MSITAIPQTLMQRLAELSIEYNIMTFLVGTVMGIAINDFVRSANSDIITPILLGTFGTNWQDAYWTIGASRLDIGDFIGALIQVGVIVLILVLLLSTVFRHDVEAKKAEKEQARLEKEAERARHAETTLLLREIATNIRQ